MSLYLSKGRIRYSFGKISSNISVPDLTKIQKESYENFLQLNTPKEQRQNQGLEHILRSVLQIYDPEERAKLEYVSYTLGTPK